MGWVANATPEVDAQSQWAAIIAVCIVLSMLSVAAVLCRLWIRSRVIGRLDWDDYMSALSMIFAVVYSILCILQTKFGLGLPLALRPKLNIVPYTQINFAGRPIYQIGISFFKVALLVSYLRLLQGTSYKFYRLVVLATIVVVFLAHLGCAFALVFACNPVGKSWKPWLPGDCLQPGPSFTGYAVVTIVSDIMVAILPIPMLLKLNVRLQRKVSLVGIFMLGLFTTLCSILRYLQINRIQNGDGNSTMLVLWGTIEFNVGNMVSSLPFMAPLCMKDARRNRSKYSGGSDKNLASSQGVRNGEQYNLSDVRADNSAFSSGNESGSETNVPTRGIMKSISFSIEVDNALKIKEPSHPGEEV